MTAQSPVRVMVMNDYALIVAGMTQFLAGHSDRVIVVDQVLEGEPITVAVDVALYDTYGRIGLAESTLRSIVDHPMIGNVVIFSLDLGPELIAAGRKAGAAGFISKALDGDDVVDAIVRVAAGELVECVGPSESARAAGDLDWPGRDDGLSERESQVIVLLAEGLTNREIAAALYLSTETVKGHVSLLFAKLNLRNRVEATNYVHSTGAFDRYSPVSSAEVRDQAM